MIRLVRLAVDGFKQLQDIDLAFPPRCCVLIEGLNEAGKSSLFEAIYTALYGRGLVLLGGGRGQSESMIGNDRDGAVIELELVSGDAQLAVRRRFRRGHVQEASLLIRDADGSCEEVRGAMDVTREMIEQLNGLDGEALLASCFVQQKKLGQLEEVGRAERQAILLKLLDLDPLTRLKQRFPWGAREEQELAHARRQQRLAEVVRLHGEAAADLATVGRQLHLVDLLAAVKATERHAAEVERWSAVRREQDERRAALDDQLARGEALDTVIATLRQILDVRQWIEQRLATLHQIADRRAQLDRIEQELLPSRRAEASDLAALDRRIAEIERAEGRQRALTTRAEQLRQARAMIEEAERQASEAERWRAETRQQTARRTSLDEQIEAVELLEAVTSLLEQLEDARQVIRQRQADLRHVENDLVALEQVGKELPARERELQGLNTLDQRLASIELIEADLARLSARRERLWALVDQYDALAELRVAHERASAEVTAVQRWVDAAAGLYQRAQQARALRAWAAAARDDDWRRRLGELSASLEARATVAAERQQAAERHLRRAHVLFVVGGIVAIAGLVGAAVLRAYPTGTILAILATLAGFGIIGKAWLQRRGATTDLTAAEREAQEYRAQARDEQVRQQAVLVSQAPDLGWAVGRLRELGLEIPADAERAEGLAATLEQSLPQGQTADQLQQGLDRARDELHDRAMKAHQASGQVTNEDRQIATALSLEAIADVPAARVAIEELSEAIGTHAEQVRGAREAVVTAFAEHGLPHDIPEARKLIGNRQGALEEALNRLRAQLASREQRQERRDRLRAELDEWRGRIDTLHQRLRTLQGRRVVPHPDGAFDPDREAALLREMRAERPLHDLPALKAQREAVAAAATHAEANARWAEQEHARQLRETRQLLHHLSVTPGPRLDRADVEVLVTEATQTIADLATEIEGMWQREATAVEQYALPRQVSEARRLIGQRLSALEQVIANLEEDLLQRAELEEGIKQLQDEMAAHRRRIVDWHVAIAAIAAIAQISAPAQDHVAERQLLESARAKRAAIDVAGLKTQREQALATAAEAAANAAQAQHALEEQVQVIHCLFAELGVPPPQQLDRQTIGALVPDVVTMATVDRQRLVERREQVLGQFQSLLDEITRLESELRVSGTTLDDAECMARVETLEQQRAICRHAGPILDEVRDSILRAVLPSTLDYMRQMLPLLTVGRYHDAELNDTTYKMRVWDAQKRAYVDKDIFSGATQDQFSLALRLGFALAALPQERGARPSFIFLDEPTAGFDGQRRAALVELLTRGELAERFEQIFLAVPEGAFPENSFPQYLRLANGRIVAAQLA